MKFTPVISFELKLDRVDIFGKTDINSTTINKNRLNQ